MAERMATIRKLPSKFPLWNDLYGKSDGKNIAVGNLLVINDIEGRFAIRWLHRLHVIQNRNNGS